MGDGSSVGPEESLSGRCVISVARWLQEERAGVGVGGSARGRPSENSVPGFQGLRSMEGMVRLSLNA